MDMNQIAKMISQKMNLNQSQQDNLSSSIEKAKEILNSSGNPTEALKKANVDVGFISKVRGYLNNPMYAMFLPMVGINKQVALQKLDSLERMLKGENENPISNESNQVATQQGQVDDLERFRKGLNSFKF